MKNPKDKRECFRVDVFDEVISDSKRLIQRKYGLGLEKTLTKAFEEMSECEQNESLDCLQHLDAFQETPYHQSLFEELKEEKQNEESKMELKALPPHLKYVFLASDSQKPVITNSCLFEEEEEEEKILVKFFKENIEAIGSPLLSDCKKPKP